MIARVFRSVSTIVLLAGWTTAAAQTPPNAPSSNGGPAATVTLLTSPPGTLIRLEGHARMRGAGPLDLPPWMYGRYSVIVEGPGASRTHGVVYLPEGAAEPPALLSEPPGLSAGLLVRSLNYPGVPDISARREARGLALALAGTGAAFAAARAHLRYRDRLEEFGGYAARRAEDERSARNAWFTYGLAVWGASAVDYWIRPRFELQDPAPTHATIALPSVSRAGAAWRSLLVPGAGQAFANHATRGTLWLTSFLAAGAAFTIADGAVVRNQTKLDWTRVMVDSAGPSERARLLQEVEVRKNDLQSSEDVRRGLRYAVIGVYTANFLDALLMPIRRPRASGPPRVSAAFPVGPDHAGIALTYRF